MRIDGHSNLIAAGAKAEKVENNYPVSEIACASR